MCFLVYWKLWVDCRCQDFFPYKNMENIHIHIHTQSKYKTITFPCTYAPFPLLHLILATYSTYCFMIKVVDIFKDCFEIEFLRHNLCTILGKKTEIHVLSTQHSITCHFISTIFHEYYHTFYHRKGVLTVMKVKPPWAILSDIVIRQ